MKNYLILPVLFLLLWGCQEAGLNSSKAKTQLTDDELARLALLDNNYTILEARGRDMALSLASKFLDSKDGVKRTISSFVTVPSLYSITGKTLIKTDFAVSKPATPSLYVANFNDHKGFVILSADKRAPGILAIVGSGAIDSTSHIGLRIFLENSMKHIDEKVAKTESFRGDAIFKSLVAKLQSNVNQNKSVDGGRVEQLACTQNIITDPYNSVISTNYITSPLLKTLWDQGPPFNYGMPDAGCNSSGYCGGANTKYLAGCVPVAEGQVVAYFYARRNVGDWSSVTTAQTGCAFSGSQSSEVSSLLHNIYLDYGIYTSRTCAATAAGMQVGDISVTNPRGISPPYGLNTGNWRSWNTGDMRNSLANGSPVVICGNLNLCCFIYCWGCGEGHEWVVDGMRDINMTTTYEVITTYSGGSGNCPPNSVAYYTTTSTINTQIHQNWGWGPGMGSDPNDWYNQDVFQSNIASTSTGDINFDHANYIVAYITPN